jgi:Mce-associated membrane protein
VEADVTDHADPKEGSVAVADEEPTAEVTEVEATGTEDGDASTDAPDAEEAGAEEEDRPGRRGRGLLADARVAWAIAGLALLGFIITLVVALPVLSAERDRTEVRERAEIIAARVTTFEGATIEDWVAETRALATGEYAQQLTDVFDQELRAALRENEVQSVGEIQRSFVQSLEGDQAEVFVLARQTSVNAQREQPIEDELRIEVTLLRVDGEWLASDIVVLGPQAPVAPGSAPLPERTAPSPAPQPEADAEADPDPEAVPDAEADAEVEADADVAPEDAEQDAEG